MQSLNHFSARKQETNLFSKRDLAMLQIDKSKETHGQTRGIINS